jgi:hypothetical protein
VRHVEDLRLNHLQELLVLLWSLRHVVDIQQKRNGPGMTSSALGYWTTPAGMFISGVSTMMRLRT